MGPLVSVVVPVFNGMPHLPALTESLLAQDYPDLEIVFSEGGSTDASPEFLASLDDPRVRIVTQPPGTTAGGNWTASCQAASGELIKLACQDDLLKPGALTRQARLLLDHPTATMAVAQRDIVDAHGHVLYRGLGCGGLPSGKVPGSVAIRACYVQGTNVLGEPVAVLFRRDPLLASMPWDDTNPLVLDLTMYERVAALGDVVVDRTSIAAFRVSGSSWSTRLAKVQIEQFRRWQHDYAASLPGGPARWEHARASAGRHWHALRRRSAYRWLALKGSFGSEG
ncbi:MAG: glycosyltransferase family A protein [Actinomycetota bacterium]|nr:glycosyltransferase family A protein [Actinomycetota bacterium]